MLSWKEKVAEKLSRLLADSPSSPSSPSVADLANSRCESQGTSLSPKELTSPNKSSLSSYVLSFLPRTNSTIERIESNTLSLSNRWNRNGLILENKPVELTDKSGSESETDEPTEPDRNLDYPNGTEQEVKKVELRAFNDGEYLHYLNDKSTFLSNGLFEFFQSSLPNIVKGCKWVLLYSTWKHGISLRTLLRKTVNIQGPCLLIVGDVKGAVFGGLVDCPLKPTPKRKYQGTNQTFVFTTRYGEPRLFRPTGANRYYYLCLSDTLAFGGGGSFALCLDEDLLHGSSGLCDTFGNACLAHDSEFELKNVELWGFAHSWSHLS